MNFTRGDGPLHATPSDPEAAGRCSQPAGTTGSNTWDGCASSWWMLLRASILTGEVAGFSPVLPLTSKRGKLLDDISSLIRWPLAKQVAGGE